MVNVRLFQCGQRVRFPACPVGSHPTGIGTVVRNYFESVMVQPDGLDYLIMFRARPLHGNRSWECGVTLEILENTR